MKHIILYPPIDRDALELLLANTAVALSFKEAGNGAWSIEARDTKIVKKYHMPHSVINWTEMKEQIRLKEIKVNGR